VHSEMETLTKPSSSTTTLTTKSGVRPLVWRPAGGVEDEEPTINEEKRIPTMGRNDDRKGGLSSGTSQVDLGSIPKFSPLFSFQRSRNVFSPPFPGEPMTTTTTTTTRSFTGVCLPRATSGEATTEMVGQASATASRSATATASRSASQFIEAPSSMTSTPPTHRQTTTTTTSTTPLTPLSANHPHRTPRPRMGTKMVFPNSMICSYQNSPTIISTTTNVREHKTTDDREQDTTTTTLASPVAHSCLSTDL